MCECYEYESVKTNRQNRRIDKVSCWYDDTNVDCIIIDLNVLNVDVDIDVDVNILKIETRFVTKNDDAIVDTLIQKKKLHEYFH